MFLLLYDPVGCTCGSYYYLDQILVPEQINLFSDRKVRFLIVEKLLNIWIKGAWRPCPFSWGWQRRLPLVWRWAVSCSRFSPGAEARSQTAQKIHMHTPVWRKQIKNVNVHYWERATVSQCICQMPTYNFLTHYCSLPGGGFEQYPCQHSTVVPHQMWTPCFCLPHFYTHTHTTHTHTDTHNTTQTHTEREGEREGCCSISCSHHALFHALLSHGHG